METWDLFDGARQPLHRIHRRGEPIPPGAFHIVVEVWTINSRRQVLLTLRDPAKDEYPNKWENTGGSALAGETSRQAAIRELYEETGIVAAEDELCLLGTYPETSAFVDIYALCRDIPLSELRLQPGETVDAKWVSLVQLESTILDASLALPTGRRLAAVKEAFLEQLALAGDNAADQHLPSAP